MFMSKYIAHLFTIIYPDEKYKYIVLLQNINPLNAELNPICHLRALLGAHHILHVSTIRVKVLFVLLTPASCYLPSNVPTCYF